MDVMVTTNVILGNRPHTLEENNNQNASMEKNQRDKYSGNSVLVQTWTMNVMLDITELKMDVAPVLMTKLKREMLKE